MRTKPILCKCGCRNPVIRGQNKKWNVYVLGHNLKMPLTEKQEQKRRRKVSEALRGRIVSEETRRKISEACRNPSEETRKKMSDAHKGYIHTLEQRRKNSEAHKGKINSEEHKRRIGEAQKGKTHSEEAKIKMSMSHRGEKNPQWRGGISSELYDLKFNNKLRIKVRKRDHHTCALCEKQKTKKALSVHHIDYDKKNNVMMNLISLCLSCHGLTGTNRKYWAALFKKKIKAVYKKKADYRRKYKIDKYYGSNVA